MKRFYLFISLILTILFYGDLSAQQLEVLGGCFYNNVTKQVVIRIGVRNKTNTNGMEFTGMRFTFQYNASAVTFDGYKSYTNSIGNSLLDDASFLSFIGPDTESNSLGQYSTADSNQRVVNFGGGVTKTLLRRYINRSTTNCSNVMPLAPDRVVVLMDINFKLVNDNPEFYKLNTPGYGINSPDFIAQFIGSHEANLNDIKKEIAVVVIRNGNPTTPDQPFDMGSCNNEGKVNPITVNQQDMNFISPIGNSLLKGAFDKVQLRNRYQDKVGLSWEYLSNEMVKRFEIERAVGSDKYELVKTVIPKQVSGNASYYFNDINFNASQNNIYRIKAVLNNGENDISQTLFAQKKAGSVSVYPNPAKNTLQTVLSENITNAQYRIFSSTGNLVKSVQKTGSLNKLEIQDLLPGLYFLEIVDLPTGERITTPFQKN